jgi:hypothetical protein
MSDPFGRALRDFHRGTQDEPLVQRDGEEAFDHPIERFYFGEFVADDEEGAWLASRLDGPLLDMGAGAGRHSLYFQERFETVAIEVSHNLVETMRERGVRDARRGDMFSLREPFERDRFRSALANGTQLGLAGSMQGIRRFLGNLAFVTTPDATAVVDCYDPDDENAPKLLGFRDDPTPGLAYRLMHFEYEGDVSETLLFRLFSPSRLREAAVGTGWAVDEIRRGTGDDRLHYRAALVKE